MIKVVNKKEFGLKVIDFQKQKIHANWVYIGRGSALGNQFPITKKQNRKAVIQMYREWLWDKIKANDQRVISELRKLLALNKEFVNLYLVCSCKPLPCHGDVIKSCIEWAESRQK